MKTRWVTGKIIKTMPGTFTNFQGNFEPGSDQRSSTFEQCFEIFSKMLQDLIESQEHLEVFQKLASSKNRSVAYENVFTYIDPTVEQVHLRENVRLVNIDDISWLINSRSIIRQALNTQANNKIKTKSYLTDRSQTGTDQTNRAKRWEILSSDFQHATIEQCWSVERKLLSELAHFKNFPPDFKEKLIKLELFAERGDYTRCPITLSVLDYEQFIGGSRHGESQFQVGHLQPLKSGGNHSGENVSWISNDGNRIQGDLELDEVRKLIKDISLRMNELGY